MLPELARFLDAHWEEVGFAQEARSLGPRFGDYLAGEAAGRVLAVILRHDKAIAGYWIGFLGPEMHHSDCLSATTDIFYIRPEFRQSGGLGSAVLRLLRGVERELRLRGVLMWYTDLPLAHDYGRLLPALGHKPVSTFFCKQLGA